MYTSLYDSPLGLIRITASDKGVLSVLFDEGMREHTEDIQNRESPITIHTVKQLTEYFSGERQNFDISLSPKGTDFQQSVWAKLVEIPFGKTDSYSSIAAKLNNPLSIRAVGAANGKNPISIIIPCHRIIGIKGNLTGYAGGLWRKEYLLNLESIANGGQGKLW